MAGLGFYQSLLGGAAMGTLFIVARGTRMGCIAAIAVAALVAHGPSAIAQTSLEDALKVIDQARGGGADKGKAAAPVSFVPPPRTIADITAILDRQKPDAAKLAANRAAADAQPPAGAAGAAFG